MQREMYLPTIMILGVIILFSICAYIEFGPHIIYQDTVVIKQIFWEDGDLCFFSQQHNVYCFSNTENLTWKKALDMKNNDTLHITNRKDVIGGNRIISIRDE